MKVYAVLTVYITYETLAGSKYLILIIQMKGHVVLDRCNRVALRIHGIEEKGCNEAIGARTSPASKYWGNWRSYLSRRNHDPAVSK